MISIYLWGVLIIFFITFYIFVVFPLSTSTIDKIKEVLDTKDGEDKTLIKNIILVGLREAILFSILWFIAIPLTIYLFIRGESI